MGETLLSASAGVGKVWEDQNWPGGGSGFCFQFLDKLSSKEYFKDEPKTRLYLNT